MKREISKLVADPSLALPRGHNKKGFVGMFLESHRQNPKLFFKLWLGYLYPNVVCHDKKFAASKSSAKFALSHGIGPVEYGLIRVKREKNGYEVHLPMLVSDDLRDVAMMCHALRLSSRTSSLSRDLFDVPPTDLWSVPFGNPEDKDIQFKNDFVPKFISEPLDEELFDEADRPIAVKAPNSLPMFVDPKTACRAANMPLLHCFRGIYSEVTQEGVWGSWLAFHVTANEVAHLVNTPWQDVRDIDVQSLLISWAKVGWGVIEKPAPISFGLAQIAESLPEDPEVAGHRISKYGLTMCNKGLLHMMPKSLDETEAYEAAVIKEADRGEWFASHVLDKPKVYPFASRDVLIDWVNAKYVYTNTSGTLDVQDLSRYFVPNATSIMCVLSREIQISTIQALERYARELGVEYVFNPDEKESREFVSLCHIKAEGKQERLFGMFARNFNVALSTKVVEARTNIMTSKEKDLENRRVMTWLDLTSMTCLPALYTIGKKLVGIYEQVLAKREGLVGKYSPVIIAETFGMFEALRLAVRDLDKLKAEDAECRAEAIEQGEEEGFEAEPVPLIAKGRARLPHQYKTANITRNHPRNLLLGVHAGGGKSLLTLLDSVRTMMEMEETRPYILTCPGHLMEQYLQEVVFFFSGRINVIPINTGVIRRFGLDQLGQIIEGAPRNTILLLDMDCARLSARTMFYGSEPVTIYPVVSFLRQFNAIALAADESHLLKNDTSRSEAIMSLTVDIPYKRLASATMAYDSPSDLAGQVNLVEPALFGTRDEFNLRYAEDKDSIRGSRVVNWRKNAAVFIKAAIRNVIVYVEAGRKEWAALLPPVEETFLRVSLSEAQMEVYNALLQMTLKEIRENKELMSRLRGTEDEDDQSEADLASLLRPYLARLERFVSAPDKDDLGYALKGKDRVSPKVRKLAERIREQLKQGRKKVVVFCNYVETTNHIVENLPEDLREMTLLYRAESKTKHIREFRTNPKYQVMVGVEASLNTGRNFQYADRLVRYEHGYTPGALEQGNSRFVRPELKSKDDREKVTLDWLVADQTIDVTKVARLISKLVTVAKYENSSEASFQALPDVEVIKMSLENIASLNDWDTSLAPYASVYAKYHAALEEMYEAYRKEFKAKYGDNYLFEIERAKTPKWAMAYPSVPWIPGVEIYGSEKLGLKRLDIAMSDMYGDADVEGRRNSLIGGKVLTDFGEGVLRRVNNVRGTCSVEIKEKNMAYKCSEVFMVPKGVKNPLAELLAMRNLPVADAMKFSVHKKKKQLESVELDLILERRNGRACLVVHTPKGNARRLLGRYGFSKAPQFNVALMQGSKTVARLLKQIDRRGLKLPRAQQKALRAMAATMAEGVKGTQAVGKAMRSMDIPDINDVKAARGNNLNLFPYTVGGSYFVAAPTKGQSGNQSLFGTEVKNVDWEKAGEDYVRSFKSRKALKAALLKLAKEPGVTFDKKRAAQQYKLL